MQTNSDFSKPADLIPSAHTRKIAASMKNPRPLSCFWNRLVNLGYASDLQELDLDQALTLIHDEAGFVYGRICRITDLVIPYLLQGKVLPDFTSVFSLLDQLLLHGMLPFLELGNKSFLIQESNLRQVTLQNAQDSDVYYDHLLEILPALMRALVNHYGQESVSTWRMEVSYNYTDRRELEHFSFAAYLSVLRKIIQVVHTYAPGCQIGGPGFNDWRDPGAMQAMFEMFHQADVLPDFYTLYLYPVVDEPDGSVGISQNPDILTEYVQEFTAMARVYSPTMEIWVTECSSNISARNYLNDSCYQAAFLFRLILAGLESRLQSLGYFLFSDAPLRYMDTIDLVFGGLGLLADSGLKKPSFQLYRLFGKLGAYTVYRASDAMIAMNSQGSFQILLGRYCHPRAQYLATNIPKDCFETPVQVFDGCGTTLFHIRLRHVFSGTYLIREYRLNTNQTSLLHTWRELDYLNPEPSGDYQDYFLRSQLLPESRTCSVGKDGTFTMNVSLTDVDVCFIICELH